MFIHVLRVVGGSENASHKHPLVSAVSLVGQLTDEASKRTVVLSGIKPGTDRQAVEQLAGNMKRVRQLRYPVVMHDGATELCAAIVYRGKRDAIRAIHRLQSESFAGHLNLMLLISIYCLTVQATDVKSSMVRLVLTKALVVYSLMTSQTGAKLAYTELLCTSQNIIELDNMS